MGFSGVRRSSSFLLVALFSLALVSAGAAGCSRSKATPVDEDLGKLPWLRHCGNVELVEELARIEEENGTPEQLEAGWPADVDNVAVGLTEVFKPGALKRGLQRAEQLMPERQFVFGAVELVPVSQFRQGYETQRLKIVAALNRKTCRFKIQHTEGLLADLTPLDVVRLAVRLEGFRVAERLGDARPVDAIEPLSTMFQLVRLIGVEPHVAYRLEAANLREDTLRVLAAVAQHPQASPAVLNSLRQLVARELAAWPDDRQAWVGDRATGLHLYEMVRDGQILSLLTDDEMEKLNKDGTLAHLPLALRAEGVLDADEYYYMQTMRRILAACEKPYYERRELFAQIRDELDDSRRSSEFRFVSGRMLLPPIEDGHRAQARDRARCEAWALALAKAAGSDPPEWKTNPLSGKPYRLEVQNRDGRPAHVVVSGIGDGTVADDEPIVVPVPRSRESP